jgi:WD40 repeat protein
VSCGFEEKIYLWNPMVEKPIKVMEGHEGSVMMLELMMDTKSKKMIIISCDNLYFIRVWNLTTYESLTIVKIDAFSVINAILLSKTQRRLSIILLFYLLYLLNI